MTNYYNIPVGNTNFLPTGTGIVQFNPVAGQPGGTDWGLIGDDVDLTPLSKMFDIIKAGTPLVQVYQVLQETESSFQANSLQIQNSVFSQILGGDPVTSIASSLVSLSSTHFTFAAFPLDASFQAFYVGPNIQSGQTLYTLAATPVLLVYGTDYTLDRANGWVIAIPGNAITNGQTVSFTGGYIPPASRVLALGNYLQTTFYALTFTNVRPNGDTTVYYFPKVMADGKLNIKYKPKNSGGMKVTGKWRGVYMAGYTAPDGSLAPYGYIQETVQNGV